MKADSSRPGRPRHGRSHVAPRPGYDRPVSTVVDELQRVRLFAGLSQRQLRQLARLVKQREFRPGVNVVEEGTMSGVGFFIVAEGEASVSVDGSEVARIGAGDHFGELALITEDARTATVTAVTRLRCHVIAFWDFRKFAKENPDVSWKLLQHLAGLLTAERERRARASLLVS
jgi:CRP-like cAMP-binding protein